MYWQTTLRLLGLAALMGWTWMLPATAWASSDKSHGSDGHGKPPVVKAHVHTDKGEAERKFDLANEEQKKELFDLLAKGAANEVVQDKPPALLDIKWDLGLWSVVVFVVLFFGLSKYAWPQILEGLQKREANIQHAFAEADRCRADAQAMRQQFEQQIAQANDKVRQMLEDARRDAQQTTDEMLNKARNEIKAERDRLRREIDTARDQALKDVWEQAVQLASVMSSKLIRRQLTVQDQKQLLDESLAELKTVASQQAPSKN